MNFTRINTVEKNIVPKRVLVVYGPRRVGKTTSLKKYLETQKEKEIFSSVGDDIKIRELFNSEDKDKILDFAKPYDVIAIDDVVVVLSFVLFLDDVFVLFVDDNVVRLLLLFHCNRGYLAWSGECHLDKIGKSISILFARQ